MTLAVNSDYFPKYQRPVGPCNLDTVFLIHRRQNSINPEKVFTFMMRNAGCVLTPMKAPVKFTLLGVWLDSEYVSHVTYSFR